MTQALITGATSGIGLAFAKALASDRHDLVLVARTAADLERTAAELREEYGVGVEILQADLAERAEMQRVADRLSDGESPIDVLVNNAGYGLKKGFLEAELADTEAMDAVLYRAVLVLSHAAALSMRSRRYGAILNVTSMASYTAMGVYAASKSAATVFTEALANELRGTGVTATAVLPGFVHTDFHRRAKMRMDRLPGWLWLEPEHVVGKAIADARAGKAISIAGPAYQLAAAVSGLVPRGLIRRASGGVRR